MSLCVMNHSVTRAVTRVSASLPFPLTISLRTTNCKMAGALPRTFSPGTPEPLSRPPPRAKGGPQTLRTDGSVVRRPQGVVKMVFGMRLADCVRDTAVDSVQQELPFREHYHSGGEWSRNEIPRLEDRLLPVLVLRCAQNLLARGPSVFIRYALGLRGSK